MQRALALGLDAHHPVLARASNYLRGIINGETECSDPAEKNGRWLTGVQLFASATLAIINPNDKLIDSIWELWNKIANNTFISGEYDQNAEIRAHQDLTGASVKNSYLTIDNRYSLALLGARAKEIPPDVEANLVDWIWYKDDGIKYLGENHSFVPREKN